MWKSKITIANLICGSGNIELLLNFYDVCPANQKEKLLSAFYTGQKPLCSSERYFKIEICKLQTIFAKNCHFRIFLKQILRLFLDQSKQADTIELDEAQNPKLILKVPYLGKLQSNFLGTLRSE